jgi:ATP-dependent Lon protease
MPKRDNKPRGRIPARYLIQRPSNRKRKHDDDDEEDESDEEDSEEFETETEDEEEELDTDEFESDEEDSEEDDEYDEEDDSDEDEYYTEEDLRRMFASSRSRRSKQPSPPLSPAKSAAAAAKNAADLKLVEDIRESIVAVAAEDRATGNKAIQRIARFAMADLDQYKDKLLRAKATLHEKQKSVFKGMFQDKASSDEFGEFMKLESEKQLQLYSEMAKVNELGNTKTSAMLQVLASETIPMAMKAIAVSKMKKISILRKRSGDYSKLAEWVEGFMRIPFATYAPLPVSIADGTEKCTEFMVQAQKTLNDTVFGLDQTKMQIMQFLGQLVTNPTASGMVIGIQGPPGTGKTSLVKKGISQILNRHFSFISLGGATDSAFLNGHSFTYEGSVWGKIAQTIMESKHMNPVIYFDELDKLSDTPRGEEIANLLIHLTDPSQNTEFHDRYFSELSLDLSRCLFIFSFNSEAAINPVLKDRMNIIHTSGYTQKEKITIATDHLLPDLQRQIVIEPDQIVLPTDTMSYLIESVCTKEDGVRNFKRCLETIHTKLNLYRFMSPDSTFFSGQTKGKSLQIDNTSFPVTVTRDIVDKLIESRRRAHSGEFMYN